MAENKLPNFIIEVLKKANFIYKYKQLSDLYRNDIYGYKFQPEELLPFLQELRYDFKFGKQEGFYINDINNNWDLSTGLYIKSNIVEIGTNIHYKNQKVGASAPWGLWYKKLTGDVVFKPVFSSLEELKNIFKDALRIHEDIKNELIKIENPDLTS